MTIGEAAAAGPRPRLPGWAGDLIAAVLVLVTTVLPFPGLESQGPEPVIVVLAVVSAAALPLRRRWPIPILGICIIVFGISCLLGVLNAGAALAVAVAMFAVTDRSDRRLGVAIGIVTICLTVALSLLADSRFAVDPRLVQFALGVGLAAAAGDATRSRREYFVAVTERAERAEQTREAEARRRVSEERLKIARDLHDVVAHQIAVISLNAGVASSAIDNRPDKAKESLATIRSASRTVLTEIGDLLALLRGDDGAAEGVAAPQPGLDRLNELIGQFEEAGLEVTARIEGDLRNVTGAADVVAYRTVQEALTNAHKHGGEHRAHLLLSVADGAVTIVVTNPMTTTDTTSSTGSRLGLLGLRERVASVRGTVETGPVPGAWRVAAQLPLTLKGETR